MTIEQTVALVTGVLTMVAAVGLIVDAALAKRPPAGEERRRRTRAERNRLGEFLIGLGLACLAVAFFGTDRWRFGTVAILCCAVCVTVGVVLNRRLLAESVRVRGAARRRR
jgi:hypothetical protein